MSLFLPACNRRKYTQNTFSIKMNMPSCYFTGQDARLVEHRQQKEQVLDSNAALDRFLAGVEKRAYRMTHIATSNSDDALDIIQDAMLTLVRRYANKPEREWGPLFHRILQNQIRDWYRRQKVRNRLIAWFSSDNEKDDFIHTLPAAENSGPLAQVNNAAMTEKLEQALQNLPLRQQQTFLLRVWEGLNVNETARAMGISSGSVKTHYSRAVHSLREKLGDYYDAG